VGHLGPVFYRFTMPRLTNAQKQQNYRKRKKEAEEGKLHDLLTPQATANHYRDIITNTNSNTVNFVLSPFPLKQLKHFNTHKKRSPTFNLSA
jgi:hypothetical protein